MTYLASLILIGICFIIIYGINRGRESVGSHKDIPSIVRVLSIICSIVVTIINIALRTVVR
jgi:hypothetical protein